MKFKFGDKVRITNCNQKMNGKEGFVSATMDDGLQYHVTTAINSGWYIESELELVEPDMTAEEEWDIARRIVCADSDCLDDGDMDEIFGSTWLVEDIFSQSPQSARDKIRAWEEAKEEIKVGDVVVNISGERYLVINVEDPDRVRGINLNGQAAVLMRPINCVKTGKYIDIQSILDQIGGVSDETD